VTPAGGGALVVVVVGTAFLLHGGGGEEGKRASDLIFVTQYITVAGLHFKWHSLYPRSQYHVIPV
jgi:hypothetical protein